MFRLLTRSDLLQLIGLGILGSFLYSTFYYASLRMLPSADACIINYLWPIIATISAAVILHEKIKVTEGLAILLSFVGVVIISTKGNGLNIANQVNNHLDEHHAENVIKDEENRDYSELYRAVNELKEELRIPVIQT